MSKKSRIMMVVLFPVLGAALLVKAQDLQQDTAIPACNFVQLTATREILDDFDQVFTDTVSGGEEALRQLDILQTRWWDELEPSMPRCTFAVDASQITGRVIDEAILAITLQLVGEADRAASHAERYTIVANEFNALEDRIDAMMVTPTFQPPTFVTQTPMPTFEVLTVAPPAIEPTLVPTVTTLPTQAPTARLLIITQTQTPDNRLPTGVPTIQLTEITPVG